MLDYVRTLRVPCAIAPSAAGRIAAVLPLTAALMLGACAQTGSEGGSLLGSTLGGPQVAGWSATAPNDAASPNGKPDNRTELEKATEYWGKQYREKPTNKDAGLAYAKNLRALGEKRQALAVLQQVSFYFGHDKEVASEYGRLALDLDQVGIARQMLAVANDPANPDWRVISAMGTILAKDGKFTDAIPVFERALTLAPDQSSVMNNLAMAYAMAGDAARAEQMLRKIETSGAAANPKIRQNLALVLGLQGKFDESKSISTNEIGQDGAAANASLLRQFVKVSPAGQKGAPAVAGWSATTTTGKPGAKGRPAAAAADEGAPHIIEDVPATPAAASTPIVREGGDGAPLLRGMSR